MEVKYQFTQADGQVKVNSSLNTILHVNLFHFSKFNNKGPLIVF